MNILFFEFDAKYTDELLGLFNVRDYDIVYAFANAENATQLAIISEAISAPINAIVINNDATAEQIAERTILEALQKNKTYSAFFTICHKQKALEKVALNLSATAKIKACFVCLEDCTSSIFDVSDTQFIRMCFDIDDYNEVNDTHVSTNKKAVPHLVGKFAFLEKILQKNS